MRPRLDARRRGGYRLFDDAALQMQAPGDSGMRLEGPGQEIGDMRRAAMRQMHDVASAGKGYLSAPRSGAQGMGKEDSRQMKEATDPSNCWQSPLELIARLGRFDLDPCADSRDPERLADAGYTAEDDGLAQPWGGRVFCNPPYGRHSRPWLERCKQHNDAIALVTPKSIGARWFQDLLRGSSVLFLRGRVQFVDPLSGFPAKANTQWSILIAWGSANRATLRGCSDLGLLAEFPE